MPGKIAGIFFILWPGFLFAQTKNPVVLSISDRWKEETGIWEKSVKQAYGYDDLGREIYFGYFRWNAAKSDWKLTQEKTHNYTEGYTETIEISYGKKKEFWRYVKRVDHQSDQIIFSEELHSDSLGNKEGSRYSLSYFADGGWDGVQEDFNNTSKSWQISKMDYSRPRFDANGCKIGTDAGNRNGPTTQETIQNDDQCRPLVILSQIWEYQGNLRNYSLDSIFYTGQVITSKRYRWNYEDSTWYLTTITLESADSTSWVEYYEFFETVHFHARYEFDEQGNRIFDFFEYQLLPDTNWIIDRLNTFEYNDEGDLSQFIVRRNYIDSLQEWKVYYEYFYSFNAFNDWSRVDATIRNLDDAGQVIEKTQYTNYEYDYFCRDLARLRTGSTDGIPSTRTFYNYLYPENCASSPVRELIAYPNPSRGFVYLESDQLTAGSVDITLTNIAGQVLRNIEVRQLTGLLEIDLSNQLDGLYFIWLKSGHGTPAQLLKVLKH